MTDATHKPVALLCVLLFFSTQVFAAEAAPVTGKILGTVRPAGLFPNPNGRFGHTVTILPTGNVFVYGELPAGVTNNKSVLLNPKERTWHTNGLGYGATRWDALGQGWENLGQSPECPSYPYLQTATQLSGNRILFAGGICDIPRMSNDPSPYPPAFNKLSLWNDTTRQWEKTALLLQARIFHTASLLADGSVLMVGGEKDEQLEKEVEPVLDSVELYQDSTADRPAQTLPAEPLKTARARHTATVLADGTVLVAGGFGKDNKPLASVEIFDPKTFAWHEGPALSTPRYQHTATLLTDGRVMVAGGIGPSGDPIASVEIFDPATQTWTTAQPMLMSLQTHSATTLVNGDVLVIGATHRDSDHPFTLAMLWKADTGIWLPAGKPGADLIYDVNGPVPHTLLALSDGSAMFFGNKNIVRWQPASEDYLPSFGQGASITTVLKDGRVLIAGGHVLNNTLNIAEVYDPVSNRFTLTGRMHQPRTMGGLPYAASAVTDDGRVVVAGGRVRSPDSPKENVAHNAEVWDPATGQWRIIKDLSFEAQDKVHVGKLSDGHVLFLASREENNDVEATGPARYRAWLWDPATDAVTSKPVTATARAKAAVTILPDGRVLIIGGETYGHYPAQECPPPTENAYPCRNQHELWPPQAINTAEIWDSRTGNSSPLALPPSWKPTTPQAMLLKTGNVLLMNVVPPNPNGKANPAPLLSWDAATGAWSELPALPPDLFWPLTELNDGSLIAQANPYYIEPGALMLKPGASAWEKMPRNLQLWPITKQLPSGELVTFSPEAPYVTVFNPVANAWQLKLNYFLPTRDPALVELKDGRLAVLGTVFSDKTLTQIWDPKTDTWASTGKLLEGRTTGKAIRLPSGNVLNFSAGPKGSLICNIWHPDDDSWVFCGSLISADGKSEPEFVLGTLEDGRAVYMDSTKEALVFDEKTLKSQVLEVEMNPKFYHFGEAVSADKPFARFYDRPHKQWHDASVIAAKLLGLRTRFDALWDAPKKRWAYISSDFMHNNPAWLPDRCIISGPPFKIYKPALGKVTELAEPFITLNSPAMTVMSDGTVVLAGNFQTSYDTGGGFFHRKASCAGFEPTAENTLTLPNQQLKPAAPAAPKPVTQSAMVSTPIIDGVYALLDEIKWTLLAIVPLVFYLLLRHPTNYELRARGWKKLVFSRLVFFGLLLLVFIPVIQGQLESKMYELIGNCGPSQNPNSAKLPRSQQKAMCIDQKIGPVAGALFHDEKPTATLPCRYIGAWSSTRRGVTHRITLQDDGRYLMDKATIPHEKQDTEITSGYWEVQGENMLWYQGGWRNRADVNKIIPVNDTRFTLIEEDGHHTRFDLIEGVKSGSCTP